MPSRFFLAAALVVLTGGQTLQAQQTSSFQLRAGGTVFSTLVEDAPGITVRQTLAPTFAFAFAHPLSAGIDLEVSASYALSGVRGEDELQEWDAGNVSVWNALVGFGYSVRSVELHGGAGLTKLAGNDAGVFAASDGLRPLVEAGASFALPSHRAFAIDTRVQAHSFTPASWSGQEGQSGVVLRGVLMLGYTLGGAR